MTPRSVVNSVGDFLTSRSLGQYKLAALVAAVLLSLWFIRAHDAGLRDDGAQAVRDSLSASTAVRLHRVVDSLGKRVDRQSVSVTRTVHRLDTLWLAVPDTLATHADTVKALESLPVLRRSTDEAIHACTDYQLSCTEFRRVADSLETAQRAQIDGLNRRIAGQVRAGRWGTVVKWAEIGGSAFLGYRIGRAR